MLDNFDAHVSEEGINVVAETTSAIVCQLPANSTAVFQPLDVGVMDPSKEKITAKWLADISVPEEDSQPTAVEDERACRKCGLVELCVCWEECVCWDECVCYGDACLCYEEFICLKSCEIDMDMDARSDPRSNVAADEQQSVRNRQTTNQAAEKRLAAIIRTIEAWEELSEDVIVKSFQKAIPMYPTVDV
ncbi:hypothetical protein PF001_g29943 [Phytophthora fragariae]|nr:hypothetical protein PF001_g29943 [Phytophthora fragariae]